MMLRVQGLLLCSGVALRVCEPCRNSDMIITIKFDIFVTIATTETTFVGRCGSWWKANPRALTLNHVNQWGNY